MDVSVNSTIIQVSSRKKGSPLLCWQSPIDGKDDLLDLLIDENYDVPQKFLELYYRLHNAESLMRKSWEVTFDLNPKLLTHPEQVKVLRFALKPHLEFLKTLDEVLAESSGESSKTA